MAVGAAEVHYPEGTNDVIEGALRVSERLSIALPKFELRIVLSRPSYHGGREIHAVDHATLRGDRSCEMAWSTANIEHAFAGNLSQGRHHRRNDLIGDWSQVPIVTQGSRGSARELGVSKGVCHPMFSACRQPEQTYHMPNFPGVARRGHATARDRHHSDFEWQPALRFIGTPFAANRIRYCNGRNLSQSQAKNRQVDGDWSLRINSFAESYPSLFPAPAHQLVYLSSEFLAWLAP